MCLSRQHTRCVKFAPSFFFFRRALNWRLFVWGQQSADWSGWDDGGSPPKVVQLRTQRALSASNGGEAFARCDDQVPILHTPSHQQKFLWWGGIKGTGSARLQARSVPGGRAQKIRRRRGPVRERGGVAADEAGARDARNACPRPPRPLLDALSLRIRFNIIIC